MTATAYDSHPKPIYGARYRVVFPILDADGDLVTGATGLDSEISKDQGTFADCTNEATEIATASGIYYLDLTSTEMSCKSATIQVKTSSSGAKTTVLQLYVEDIVPFTNGTAQAGTASTITLAAGNVRPDGFWTGAWIKATNDSPAGILGEMRKITAYVNSTNIATVQGTWGTNPSSATTYDILPASQSELMNWIYRKGMPQVGKRVRMLSGVTDQYIYFDAYSATDHYARVTGLSSFTVYRSRNGAAAAIYTTPSITEIDATNMPGVYRLLLDEDTTIAAGHAVEEMKLYITATGMDPVDVTVELFRKDVDAPPRGVALSDIPFYMVNSTDHVTAQTGVTVSAQVSKDGGAFAAAAGTAAEVGNGLYQFDATAADMTADVVVFRFTGTNADPSLITIKTTV